MVNQLAFPFLNEITKEAEEAKRLHAEKMKRANDIAILRAHVQQYPMTNYERLVVPKGVRLARFVIGWECEGCPYASQDHSVNNKFGVDTRDPCGPSTPLVCLKDYYKRGND